MKIVQAKVTCKCPMCRLLIAEDCIRFGLKLPKDEICEIPLRWAFQECPHSPDGLKIELFGDSDESMTELTLSSSLRWKETDELEPPPWRNNFDFTKNWGFPCREAGRYGSHPSHDGFDDE